MNCLINKELAEELQKRIIRKFKKRKVHLSFLDNIWGAHLADMHWLTKSNERICFCCFVIDIYRKYAWLISLKDKIIVRKK